MAAYSFNSEPRVVSTRSDHYKPEEKMTMNLMYDKRVFRGHVHDIHNIRPVLSPQEQEELHFQKEKEKKQEEMMKRQLETFKKSKNKQSPYDIRPAATGRIEVDLQCFLTDQNNIKPDDLETAAQTDEFVPKPPDPKYVPKKTGKDVYTQIEDGDLFSFNNEVQPILNVLTSKTLEQALLEVEEESELDSILVYKDQNKAKKAEEEKSWEHMVREEAEKIQKKNLEFQAARNRYVKRLHLVNKFQDLNLAKLYLSGMVSKALNEHTVPHFHSDYLPHLLNTHYMPFIIEGTVDSLKKKKSVQEIPENLALECIENMKDSRIKLIKAHKKIAKKEQIRDINYSDTKRFIRFLYRNPDYFVHSEFTMRIDFILKGQEYPENLNDSILLKDMDQKDIEKKEGEEANLVEDHKPRTFESRFLTFMVNDLKHIAFNVANHPIVDTPKDLRKYGIHAELYSETGELVHSIDNSSGSDCPGVKLNTSCRDLNKKTSDDESLIITLPLIPESIHNIFLYTQSIRVTPAEFKYARYHLLDYKTNQNLDIKKIKPEEFAQDDNGNTMPLYLAYRIFRKEKNPRNLKIRMEEDVPVVDMNQEDSPWILEVYNLPINKPLNETSHMVKEILLQGWNYTKQLTEGLIAYRTMKLMQEIEYKKQIEENEQTGSKKKKKRPVKGKVIEEPVKMTEYIPPPVTYPSRTFGPVLIDTKTHTIETLYQTLTQIVDPDLLDQFELGMDIKIKNKPITKINWVLKASTLKDLTIEKKKPPEPQILDAISQDIEP
jgi:radial spoke head protein 3